MTYHKEEYTLHNGKKIYALYDDHNVCQATKECIEMLLDLYQQGREDAIDEFAKWLVEQGILGSRCISDGEITDYGKVYAKKYKEQLKEQK
mgnify:FL=1